MYSINRIYRLRSLAGQSFLVGSGDAIELNEIGADIWKSLKEGKSIAEIIDSITKDYDAERNMVEDDVNGFFDYLLSIDVIRKT